jgi:ParB family chromosome partitioning protein
VARNNDKQTSRPQKWAIKRLKDHPRQQEMFGNLSDAELDALAKDMAGRGQQTPVEVLPDGTIVAGHQRVLAARKLGWKTVLVVVRRDLAAAGDAAVEDHFIRDNLVRRQLTQLGRARCIRRLVEIETGSRAANMVWFEKEKLKTAISTQLGMSLRTVNRLLLLLEAPLAVQQACDRGEVPLTIAGRVALLDKDKQQEVARRIAKGEPADEVVAEALRKPVNADVEVRRSFRRLLGCLEREVPRVQGKDQSLNLRAVKRRLPVIRQAAELLGRLIEQARD